MACACWVCSHPNTFSHVSRDNVLLLLYGGRIVDERINRLIEPLRDSFCFEVIEDLSCQSVYRWLCRKCYISFVNTRRFAKNALRTMVPFLQPTDKNFVCYLTGQCECRHNHHRMTLEKFVPKRRQFIKEDEVKVKDGVFLSSTNASEISRIAPLTEALSECSIQEQINKVAHEYLEQNSNVLYDEIGIQNLALKIHGKAPVSRLLSQSELEERLKLEIIHQESLTGVKFLIDALQNAFVKYAIQIELHYIVSIVSHIVTIVAALLSGNFSPSITTIILVNSISLITLLCGVYNLKCDSDITELLQNVASVAFGLPMENVPSIPGATEEEVRQVLNEELIRPQDFSKAADDLSYSYNYLRNSMSSTVIRDPVTVAVSSLSWLLSLAAIFSIKALGWDIRSAVTHLTFMQRARDLQSSLARDLNDLQKWVKEQWLRPKDVQYRLIANRISSCERMLATSNIDIVCDPIVFHNFDELVRTNKDFIGTPQMDDGFKTLRAALSVLHVKLVEKNAGVQELAKARGLRPVPAVLHLWSSVGGVGKSAFVTNKLIPELRPIVNCAAGSETWLKLSIENKYFPPTGGKSKIYVVDEFLCSTDKDPVLAHLNGMISETPYFIDSAFEKNQTFAAEALIMMSNIPGCSLSTEEQKINANAAVALFSRLLQFEVVNISRPVEQSALVRHFERKGDFSDLRFLPGYYMPEHAPLTQTPNRDEPQYSPAVLARRTAPNNTWVPKKIQGKWELTYQELISFYVSQLEVNQTNYLQKLGIRRTQMAEECKAVEQAKIVEVESDGNYQFRSWFEQSNHLLDQRAMFWEAGMMRNAVEALGMHSFPNDMHLSHNANYLSTQYSRMILTKLAGINFENYSISPEKVSYILCLAISCKVNVVLNGVLYIDVGSTHHEVYLDLEQQRWGILPSYRETPTPSECSNYSTIGTLFRNGLLTSGSKASSMKLSSISSAKSRNCVIKQQNLELPRISFPTPKLLSRANSVASKFAIYMYGDAGAGKSYLAEQLGDFLHTMTGFPILKTGTVWWESLRQDQVDVLKARPHILINDDCCFNKHYVSVYDNAHPKTIFINTSNFFLNELCWWEKFTFRSGTWHGQLSKAISSLPDYVKKLDVAGIEATKVFPEGFIRRVGIAGKVKHNGACCECSFKYNLTIHKVKNTNLVLESCGQYSYYSGSELASKIMETYNQCLKESGEVTIQHVANYQEVMRRLGTDYKEPDVYINADSFEQLQMMLNSSSSAIRYYTNTPRVKNFIYVSTDFLRDKSLVLSDPSGFLVTVRSALQLSDIIEQGTAMYTRLLQGSTNPAVRISVANYDIYCYRNVAYIDSEVTTSEVEVGHTPVGIVMRCSGNSHSMLYSKVWQVVMPNNEGTVVEGSPVWAIHWLRTWADTVREWPQLAGYRQNDRLTRERLAWLDSYSSSFEEIFKKIVSSSYWNLLFIAGGLLSLISVGTCLIKHFTQEKKVLPSWYCEDPNQWDWLDVDFREPVYGHTYESKQRMSEKAARRLAMRNRIAAKKGSNKVKSQMVVGLDRCRVVDEPGNSNFEDIVKRVENSIVKIHCDRGLVDSKAYGMVLEGRIIIAPAHYFPAVWGKQIQNYQDRYTIEYVHRGTGLQSFVKAHVKILRRDLEILVLEVPLSERTWQNFPSIRSYFIRDSEQESYTTGFFLSHQGDRFDRFHCTMLARADYESPLTADDICTVRNIHVSWLSANCSTGPGDCGLPYVAQAHCERCIMGFHIAGSTAASYGAVLTQEILSEVFDNPEQIVAQSVNQVAATYLSSKEAAIWLEDSPEGARTFPELEWLIDYEQDVKTPVAMTSLMSPLLDTLEVNTKVPAEARKSPYIHILGYIPSFNSSKGSKLKKTISSFSEIATMHGVPNPKQPAVSTLDGAPPNLKVPLFRSDGIHCGESIAWAQVVKSCNDFQWDFVNQALLEEATSLLMPHWKKYASQPFRVLNDFEIRNGIQYGPFKGALGGLERSTSVGLPFSALHNANSKAYYLDLQEHDGQVVKVWKNHAHTRELLDHIAINLGMIAEGIMPVHFFKGSMKAELVDKTLGKKSRLFCAGSIDLQYISSMFYGTFAAAVKLHYPEMECQVGVDPIRTLSNVWNRMLQVDGQCICIDFSRWDKLLIIPIMLQVKKIVIQLIMSNLKLPTFGYFSKRPEFEKALEIIFDLNIFPTLVVEGVVFRTTRGAPSGSFFTTWLNSFANSLISAAVVAKWQHDYHLNIIKTSSDWSKHWVEANYGDDKVIRVSNALIKAGMRYSVFKDYSDRLFGTMTTPADKKGTVQELLPLEGVEFISRSPQHHRGAVWLNKLKKPSVHVLWHWIVTTGDQQGVMIQNLRIIMEEAALWGKAEYNLHLAIAHATKVKAIQLGWLEYVKEVDLICPFEQFMEGLEKELKCSIALCSPPTVGLNILNSLVGSQTKIENKVPGEDKDSISIKELSLQEYCFPESIVNPYEEKVSLVTIQQQINKMLPPGFGFEPYPNDMFKTLFYLQYCYAVRAIYKTKRPVCVLFSQDEWTRLKKHGVEKAYNGFSLVELNEGNNISICCVNKTFQLGGIAKLPQIFNAMEDILKRVSKHYMYDGHHLVYYTQKDQDDVYQRTYLAIVDHEPSDLEITTLDIDIPDEPVVEERPMKATTSIQSQNDLKESDKTPSVMERFMSFLDEKISEWKSKEVEPLQPVRVKKVLFGDSVKINDGPSVQRHSRSVSVSNDIISQMMQTPKPVGSTAPTQDANAAPAAPSTVDAQLSNQQNNGALGFGNIPADNRLAEGGQIIQITEAATKNWYQLYINGGPLINVPTTTPAGTILWQASIKQCYNNLMRLYEAIHNRSYPSVEVMLNFIGTPTWAGNLLVAVTPTAMPQGSAQVQDDWLRTWAYEQKPLSSNGTQVLELNRLINDAQSNVAWDSKTSTSDGPYIYIKMATSYEQALANENTAFQIQILSRFGPNASFGGIDQVAVGKMLAALAPSEDTIEDSTLGRPLISLSGLKFSDFLRGVLGQNLPLMPTLIVNGKMTIDLPEIETFITSKTASMGYNIISPYYANYPPLVFNYTQQTSASIGTGYGSYDFLSTKYETAVMSGFCQSSGGEVILRAIVTSSGFSHNIIEVWNQCLNFSAVTIPTFEITPDNIVFFTNQIDTPNGVVPISATNLKAIQLADLITLFQTYEFAVSYCKGEVVVLNDDGPLTATLAEHYLVRIERDGVVDCFTYIQYEGKPNNYEFTRFRVECKDIPQSMPETIGGVARGILLPDGMQRLEIATLVRPLQGGGGNVPTTMTIENAALLNFLRKQTPEGYYTTIELQSSVSGRRAMVIFYAPVLNTMAVIFPPTAQLNYAIYNGASMDQLEVRQIQTILPTSALPTSDANQWSSIWTETSSLKTVEATIKSVRMKNVPRTPRTIQLSKAVRDLVNDTISEREAIAEARALRANERATLFTRRTPSTFASQASMKASRPRQIQIGKAWNEDKQTIMTVLSLGLGGGAGAAAKAGMSAKGATSVASNTMQRAGNGSFGVQKNMSPVSSMTESTTKSPSYAGLRRNLSSYNSSVQNFASADPLEDDNSWLPTPTNHSNSSYVRNLNARTNAYVQRQEDLYESRQAAPYRRAPDSHVGQVFNKVHMNWNAGENSSSTRHFDKIQEYMANSGDTTAFRNSPQIDAAGNTRWRSLPVCNARIGATACGGMLSSAVEGGINAGLAEQQHGFDKEQMASYFENLSAQDKQNFLHQLSLLQESGKITSDQMKEQFGYDIEKMQEQLAGAKELQEDSQAHDVEMFDKNVEAQKAKEMRDMQAQGLQVSQRASMPSSRVPTVMSSGIVRG